MNYKRNIILICNSIIKNIYKFKILDVDSSIENILNNKLSVARFGDGELLLMNNNSIRFQQANKILSEKLRKIIKINNKKILICLPEQLNNVGELTEESKKYWIENLKDSRMCWFKYINKKNIYGNSQITRPYIDFKEKSICIKKFNKIKELWNNREIIIVEGEKSRLGIGNDLFENSLKIERILCPAIDAFLKYDEILNEINKLSKKKLILIALGPTATVLSYELSTLGYQAIDIGHIDIEYEWFLRKVSKKIKLENKYVNEGKGEFEVKDIVSDKYNNQILTCIK